MKNFFTALFLCSIVLFLSKDAKAQELKNTFFIEALGNGLTFTANYDMRITDNGLGGRVGIGYIGGSDLSILTIPIMGNYLLGKDGKYFEIGAGITYSSTNGGESGFFGDLSSSNIVGTLSFMYRRQPVDGGFMWKIGFAPIFSNGLFIPYWPGVGIGYTW